MQLAIICFVALVVANQTTRVSGGFQFREFPNPEEKKVS